MHRDKTRIKTISIRVGAVQRVNLVLSGHSCRAPRFPSSPAQRTEPDFRLPRTPPRPRPAAHSSGAVGTGFVGCGSLQTREVRRTVVGDHRADLAGQGVFETN